MGFGVVNPTDNGLTITYFSLYLMSVLIDMNNATVQVDP